MTPRADLWPRIRVRAPRPHLTSGPRKPPHLWVLQRR